MQGGADTSGPYAADSRQKHGSGEAVHDWGIGVALGAGGILGSYL
jgi:hypothetical protein